MSEMKIYEADFYASHGLYTVPDTPDIHYFLLFFAQIFHS